MKKISYFILMTLVSGASHAAFDADMFVREIKTGVDVVAAPTVATYTIDEAPGALGAEVYETVGAVNDDESSGSYTTQIGLGWNLSSYVRTELDFQTTTLKFSDVDNVAANYQTLGGMLYFDLARRYVQTGDITRRRTFVPFMGIGAAIGAYEFDGQNGADGVVFAAPRATVGFNVMFTDLIGLDVYYQYQMMIGNGFGWGAHAGGCDNISNIMASLRVNF